MLWAWWSGILVLGFVMGCVAAWTVGAARVFMKTLAVPLVLLLTRVALPALYPEKSQPLYVFVDFVLIALSGFAGDYLCGLKLGRHGRDGLRHDPVGH